MTSLEMRGIWNIAKGKLKQQCAKLTDDDLQFTAGKEDELLGRIQKRAVPKQPKIKRIAEQGYYGSRALIN